MNKKEILKEIAGYKNSVCDLYKDEIVSNPDQFAEQIKDQCVEVGIERIRTVFDSNLINLCLTIYPFTTVV